MYKIENQLKFEDFIFPYGKLNENNRWVKLSKIIPWDDIESKYAKKFRKKGNPAKNVRIALGTLIIQQTLNCTDRELVNQVSENPYLQFFIGLKEFQERAPFSASVLVDFRKRFSAKFLAEINELIIESENKKEDENNDSDLPNSGTLIIDATCTPADIAFPQDLSLLNKSRENLEKIIDDLHNPADGKKPRTYRKRARKDFLNTSKAKRKTAKVVRKAIGKQLNYIKRDLGYINTMVESGKCLSEKEMKVLKIVNEIYTQQKEMFDTHKHSVANRIVNLNQPHIRPIVRGKASAKTEFGAKVEISVVGGYVRVEKLSWDAYNECDSLIGIVENFKNRTGRYPERVLVDKIYRNRKNLSYCKENNIRISGPALGRPKKDDTRDRKAEYIDLCDRNAVEGKFGEGKRTHGLNRIFAKLKETSECVINAAFLVLNLNKRLRSLLQLFLEKLLNLFQIEKYNFSMKIRAC
jgi:IS5 family transposase